jgi:folate-dependent phosphoribosylglycinamide formyltransferase PurN
MLSAYKYLIITRGDFMCCQVLRGLLQHVPPQQVLIMHVTGDTRGQTGLSMLKTLFKKYPIAYLCYEIVQNLILQRAGSIKALANERGIPCIAQQNINADTAVDAAKAFNPDFIISVICPQRIKETMLQCARYSAVNVHASLLPANAGVAPHFWTMAKGESYSGSTTHVMAAELDAGNILSQQRVRIEAGDSLLKHMYSICRLGSATLLNSLITLQSGQPGIMQDVTLRSYQSHPTTAALRQFKRRGYRLFRFSEFMQILSFQERA